MKVDFDSKTKICDICDNRIHKTAACDSCVFCEEPRVRIKVDAQKVFYTQVNKALNFDYSEPSYTFTLTNNFLLMNPNDIMVFIDQVKQTVRNQTDRNNELWDK